MVDSFVRIQQQQQNRHQKHRQQQHRQQLQRLVQVSVSLTLITSVEVYHVNTLNFSICIINIHCIIQANFV